MLAMLIALVAGVVIGVFNLLPAPIFKMIDKVMGVILFLLIFTLAVGVGSDAAIFANLSALGVQALVLTLGAILGSVVFVYMVQQKWFRKER